MATAAVYMAASVALTERGIDAALANRDTFVAIPEFDGEIERLDAMWPTLDERARQTVINACLNVLANHVDPSTTLKHFQLVERTRRERYTPPGRIS